MLVAIICDTHLGIRGDSPILHDYQQKSFEWFFKEIKEAKVESILHLGDLVDRRKYVNYVTLSKLKHDFLAPLNNLNIPCHILAGNHDEYYKNTHEVNALDLLVGNNYKNIRCHTTPATIYLDGTPIFLVPWITDANRELFNAQLESTSAQICMGHLELEGFEMERGRISDHGLDRNVFDRFDVVCSGHYHHKSDTNNIHYLGAFCEYTWADYDDPRGFHLFDTQTRDLTFVPNPNKLFHKVWYSDAANNTTSIPRDLQGKMVKVIVRDKANHVAFDQFIDDIAEQNPADIQVVDDHYNFDELQEEELNVEAEDTLTIFKKYIDNLNGKFSKPKLHKTIEHLYREAKEIE